MHIVRIAQDRGRKIQRRVREKSWVLCYLVCDDGNAETTLVGANTTINHPRAERRAQNINVHKTLTRVTSRHVRRSWVTKDTYKVVVVHPPHDAKPLMYRRR
ncbi:unnamed protein product [Ectocarpus sp. 12 AP-2014]